MKYFTIILLILTPLIALISGLALAPLLAILGIIGLYDSIKSRAFSISIFLPLVFLIWPAMTILWSYEPKLSLTTFIHMLGITLAGSSSMYFFRKIEKHNLFKHLPFTFFFAAIIVTSEAIFHTGIIKLTTWLIGESYQLFLEKNINRGLCALAVLIWPAARFTNSKMRYVFPIIAAIPIFLMHSLSAKIGWLAGASIFYGSPLISKYLRKYVIISIIGLFLSCPFWISAIGPAFQKTKLFSILPPSSKHRVYIWEFAWEHIKERPLLGWGINNSRTIPGALDERALCVKNSHYELLPLNSCPLNFVYLYMVRMPLHPHNMMFQILLEQGFIGYIIFIILVLFFLYLFPSLFQKDEEEPYIRLATWLSFLTISMFAFNMWASWWLSTLFIAIILLRISDDGYARTT